MLNFGASKPRVGGARAPGAPPGSAPGLAQLDKNQTSKPVMVSCEFNYHRRQLYFLLKL